MKRLIYILLVLTLVFSVLAVNSIFVFAEGEDTSGAENTATDSSTEEAPSDEAPDVDELSGLFGDLGKALTDLKDEFVGIVQTWIDFIKSDETYTNIATIILAALAVIFIPILVALLVVVYIIAAIVITVASALGGLVDITTNLVARFMTI